MLLFNNYNTSKKVIDHSNHFCITITEDWSNGAQYIICILLLMEFSVGAVFSSCNSIDFNPFSLGYWTFRCCTKSSESSWLIMITSSQNFLCLFLSGDCSISRVLLVKFTESFSTKLIDATAVGKAQALSAATLTVSSLLSLNGSIPNADWINLFFFSLLLW